MKTPHIASKSDKNDAVLQAAEALMTLSSKPPPHDNTENNILNDNKQSIHLFRILEIEECCLDLMRKRKETNDNVRVQPKFLKEVIDEKRKTSIYMQILSPQIL